jgi:hypothetical protein
MGNEGAPYFRVWDTFVCLADTLKSMQHLRFTFNPLPNGTLATFFLTAVGPIQHTNEDDIGREKTILMM